MRGVSIDIHKFKKNLRKNQTIAENKLWYSLRDRQIEGYKFRRQVVLDKYIVDFVCFKKKLIVELDGGQHNEQTNKRLDTIRDEYFKTNGFKVLRFWNNDVLSNIEGVLRVISDTLSPHPDLLPQGEKEERN